MRTLPALAPRRVPSPAMTLAAALLAAALAAPLARPPPSPQPSPPRSARTTITGRLVFREGALALGVADAQRRVGKRIGLALRSGWQVVPARLEGDGRFVAEVAPGTWRLEWIDVGSQAEVLAKPLEVEAREGRTSCAGQIELAFSDVASELGANAAGDVRVEDRCAPGGDERRLARDAPDPSGPPRVGLLDVVAGIRTEAAYAREGAGLRLSWAVPLRRPLAWPGNVAVIGAASRLWEASKSPVDVLEAAGAFAPFAGFELEAGARAIVSGGSGVAPWAGLRWGGMVYALNARAIFQDGGVKWSFGLDLTPYWLVGRFL